MKIGELEILGESRQVLRNGAAVRLSSRAFDLLQLLVDANGAVIPTEVILAKIWPSTVVEENNIQVHICTLRRILGEDRHLIQTVSGRGYRLARMNAASTAPISANYPPQAEVLPETDLNLPPVSGQIFGRDNCVRHVLSEIESGLTGVITLTGPAGVGKSRLALEIAHRLGDKRAIDISYLPLAGCADQREVYDLIEAALVPTNVAAQNKAATSSGVRTILVIDDCDRVSDGVVRALTDSAAFRRATGTIVVVTTRTPLKITMEKVIPVPSLLTFSQPGEDNPALEMFVSRVRSLDPDVETNAVFLECARKLLEQMDGLPLAIELAAYHTSLLGIDSVTHLLEQNVDLPSGDIRRMVEKRHASVEAALMWTWPDLGTTRQTLLAKLVDAGAEADATELRCIAESLGLQIEDALAVVSDLAESSFIVRMYTGSSVTYRIPNTVRRFLWQQRLTVPALMVGRFAPDRLLKQP